MSLAETTLKTNLCWSMTTIVGQQQARNFPSCTESYSQFGSDVAYDQWSTRMNFRALRRVSPMTELQAVIEHLHWHEEIKIVISLHFSIDCDHCCVGSWAFERHPGRLSFESFSLTMCVPISSELHSFPLIMCIDAPESTTNSRSSGFFRRRWMRYPCFSMRVERSLVLIFQLYKHFSPKPMLLRESIFLVARFPEVTSPQILAHTDCLLEVRTFE